MTATREAERLTATRVVDVAHALISTHGLAWFSMRKLAAELGVNPMTVYLRFESKEQLLDAVARRGLADFQPPDLGDGPWEDRALRLAAALRSHLLSDRNILGLYSSAGRMSGAVLHSVEVGLSLMEEAGHGDARAVLAFRSLFWHTVGLTLVEEQFHADEPGGLGGSIEGIDSVEHPTLVRHLEHFTAVDSDELFAHSTRALLLGLRAAAENRPSEAP